MKNAEALRDAKKNLKVAKHKFVSTQANNLEEQLQHKRYFFFNRKSESLKEYEKAVDAYSHEVHRIDREHKEQLKFIKNMVNEKVDLISENYDAYQPFLNQYHVTDPVAFQSSRSMV